MDPLGVEDVSSLELCHGWGVSMPRKAMGVSAGLALAMAVAGCGSPAPSATLPSGPAPVATSAASSSWVILGTTITGDSFSSPQALAKALNCPATRHHPGGASRLAQPGACSAPSMAMIRSWWRCTTVRARSSSKRATICRSTIARLSGRAGWSRTPRSTAPRRATRQRTSSAAPGLISFRDAGG